MDRTQILKKLYLLKKHPELYKELPNEDLAEFLRLLLAHVEQINERVKRGMHDGYTPKEGKDYMGRDESTKLLNQAARNVARELDQRFSNKASELDRVISKRLSQIRDGAPGKDAVITESLMKSIAQKASSLIELPNFEALITAAPETIRDALELLQGDDRLSIDAIRDLREELDRRINQHESRIGATIARKLGQIGDVSTEGASAGQVLTRKSDGTYNFQTPTSSTSRTITSTSGNATMGSDAGVDYIYIITGSHTLTLPTAVGNTNLYTVRNNHTANNTINTTSSESIKGAVTSTSYSIFPGDARSFISDGVSWNII